MNKKHISPERVRLLQLIHSHNPNVLTYREMALLLGVSFQRVGQQMKFLIEEKYLNANRTLTEKALRHTTKEIPNV